MKRAYAVLFIVFVIMAILNVMKPLSSDDYFAAFVWQEGTPINGELVENPERVSGLTDIVKSTKSYYYLITALQIHIRLRRLPERLPM